MADNIFKVLSQITRQLESVGIPYMIVGSIASMVYGEPRLTRAMDIVIDLPLGAPKLAALFPFNAFYFPPEEAIASDLAERSQFSLLHHETGIKIDFIVRKDTEHARMEFERRRREPFWKSYDAFVASPEDVIIKKLQYFREGGSEKHLRDIRGILAHCELDLSYMQYWIDRLGIGDDWKRV